MEIIDHVQTPKDQFSKDVPGEKEEDKTFVDECFQWDLFFLLIISSRVGNVLVYGDVTCLLGMFGSSVSPACRSYEFSCSTGGQCVPQAWRCDGETDCMDGSDEQRCSAPCGPGQAPCLSGDQCVDHQQLCDGTPHCRDASDESVDNCGAFRVWTCLEVEPSGHRR